MPPKKRAPKGMGKPLPSGQILSDLLKKQWKLGPLVGQGGFGYLYLASDKVGDTVSDNAKFVIKMEPHSNGPLFVELAFYQRAAKEDTIKSWKKTKKLAHLGVPRYIGSGSCEHDGTKYRFMVMDRFGLDVEKIYLKSKNKFPLPTVFSLGLRIVEALEYLHENGYVHADIKSSNLMTGYGERNSNLVYLLDYGLAHRYCQSGQHYEYKEDPKRKHDGTIEYTSRDAHKGLAPCRRGDLEILSYCMLQWLCGKLPWENNLKNKDYVMKEKTRFMNNISSSLRDCLGSLKVPTQLENFFKYVVKLEYKEKPDYDLVKKWFKDALRETGTADDGKSVYFSSATPEEETNKTSTPIDRSIKKRKIIDAQEHFPDDSEQSPPKRNKRSPSKSPQKRTTPNRKTPTKKPTPRKSPNVKKANQPKRKTVKKSPGKRGKVVKTVLSPKARSAKQKESINSTPDRTRRQVRRRKAAKTVDFAQSP